MSGPPTEGPIHVVCAADRSFLLPLATMVKSVLVNLRRQTLVLHVIDGGLGLDDRRRLLRSWELPALAEVVWVEPSAAAFRELPLWGKMKLNTYHRLMMPEWLDGSVQKVIWLDADLVVAKDLTELWELDLSRNALLAAQDLTVPWVSSRYGVGPFRELGIDRMAKHFNAGVMLVHLAWWRDHDVGSRAMDYLRRFHRRVWFFDQEALNAVLVEEWGELDPRWNQLAAVVGRSFFEAEHLDSETYQQVLDDPWIVHYAGAWKPWTCLSRRALDSLYFEYLDQTDWSGWRPERTTANLLRGFYDTKLRNHLYPMERWGMPLRRWWGVMMKG